MILVLLKQHTNMNARVVYTMQISVCYGFYIKNVLEICSLINDLLFHDFHNCCSFPGVNIEHR